MHVQERFVVFDCQGDRLAGILHEPTEGLKKFGIAFIVGGPQYRVGSHRQFVLMARSMAAAGYPVLRFDHRGMGDSAGAPRAFEAIDEDIQVAIDVLLQAQPGLAGVVLLGLCDAASAIMMYCARKDPRVVGLVLANPWARTDSGQAEAIVRHYYVKRFLQRSFWEKMLSGAVDLRSAIGSLGVNVRRYVAGQSSTKAGAYANFLARMLQGLQCFTGPRLFLLSGRDLTAREFEQIARSQSGWSEQMSGYLGEIIAMPDADHTFSTASALEQANRDTLVWLSRIGPPL